MKLLKESGARVAVIAANGASLQTMSPGPLDPITRGPAAEAGRLQARDELETALSIFGS
jgi:NTE family protein